MKYKLELLCSEEMKDIFGGEKATIKLYKKNLNTLVELFSIVQNESLNISFLSSPNIGRLKIKGYTNWFDYSAQIYNDCVLFKIIVKYLEDEPVETSCISYNEITRALDLLT